MSDPTPLSSVIGRRVLSVKEVGSAVIIVLSGGIALSLGVELDPSGDDPSVSIAVVKRERARATKPRGAK